MSRIELRIVELLRDEVAGIEQHCSGDSFSLGPKHFETSRRRTYLLVSLLVSVGFAIRRYSVQVVARLIVTKPCRKRRLHFLTTPCDFTAHGFKGS